MKVWLVNPFDPLPDDPEQEGRYATLARMLAAAGHEVTWWTSRFSHRFKAPVDAGRITHACKDLGVSVRFLDAPAYSQNVSLARLKNHRILARQFAARAGTEPAPDVVCASAPPPRLTQRAAEFGKACGAKVIVDVQDLWPETFRRLAPRLLRPLADIVLSHLAKASRSAYAMADAIVGVADGYVERAVGLGGGKPVTQTIPLGVDLAAFDAAAVRGRCERHTRPDDAVWLAYTGSLSRSYDPLTILRAFTRLRDRLDRPAKLFITGRGELTDEARRLAAGADDVELTGFMDFDEWAYLLSECNVGFNASFPEAMIYLPNKIFYYLAAGCAVLNTIGGQCSRIVREAECGRDYTAGDVDSCADAVERAVNDPSATEAMGSAARRQAETTYDRRVLYPKYVELIERVAGA